MKKQTKLSHEAWLLRGISSIPGRLTLARGQVSFLASDSGSAWSWQIKRLERDAGKPGLAASLSAGEAVPVFDLVLADVQVTFPWYYFSGGLQIKSGGVSYNFSFARPGNTRGSDSDAIEGLAEIPKMRRAGKAWKAALSNPADEVQ